MRLATSPNLHADLDAVRRRWTYVDQLEAHLVLDVFDGRAADDERRRKKEKK